MISSDIKHGPGLLKIQSHSDALEEIHAKRLERMNYLENLLCSRHIDYLDLISSGLAIDATGKDIYGNME